MTTSAITSDNPSMLLKIRSWFRKTGRILRDFILNALLQRRTYQKIYPGVMHALIFWGVTVQVLGTGINLLQMQLFFPFIELPFPRGATYLAFELVMDLAGIAILLGTLMALIRRLVLRPKTLETRWDDWFALGILGLIPLVGFTLEGLRLVSASPAWSNWSPVGAFVARLMRTWGMTAEQAIFLHSVFFWMHAALGLTLLASIPFTKLRHLAATPLNILLRSPREAGELEKIENIEETEILGVGKVTEFNSRQLLSFDACVRCGRCEEACPASASGMPYSPRSLIQSFRNAMVDQLIKPNGKADHGLLGESISEDAVWYCTTCGACQAGCPAFVNPVDEIVDLRRYQVLTTGKIPKLVADTLRNLERQGNPWGIPAEDRLSWAEGLEVRELLPGESTDVLVFTGCAGAYDERNKKITRSLVRILSKVGIDFAVLGLDEMCCGETARRLGHEYIFQEFARQNIETLSKVKFNCIVTQCPHCYNTLKNEYPQFGGSFQVQHHTQYLAETILTGLGNSRNGILKEDAVAYHDSCYLGRYNQVYNPPRFLLKEAGLTPLETGKHGAKSFCCGGGGGQMWMESDPSTRINHRRLAQLMETGAGTIATACPYCLLMFDDAARSKGLTDRVEVFDIVEVLAKKLEA